ncbi:myb family transcription factor PHL5-like [Herrania umbratica]|uniref:Myb family transcription factor PHL5-like n=1 Tax=Herrania umbratica TaxID=108875 RepID=A0A6J1A8L8_9ROSI|nr:myb family transcription factor PHL5-like [Herrania umbratica]XP_021283096.1 myb family transcription factor PHL5-like [Herrania umbratica]
MCRNIVLQKNMTDSTEGKSKERSSTSDVTQLDVKTGLHLTEALQLQLDVQRRLREQLEIQRNLQLRIEEQGRQLKMMIDQQQKTNESLLKEQDLDITPFAYFPSKM